MIDNLNERVWIIYTESKELSNLDNRVFLEVYVPTPYLENALLRMKQALADRGLELLDVTRCIIFDADEWDEENDPSNEVRTAQYLARSSGSVEFGIKRVFQENE